MRWRVSGNCSFLEPSTMQTCKSNGGALCKLTAGRVSRWLSLHYQRLDTKFARHRKLLQSLLHLSPTKRKSFHFCVFFSHHKLLFGGDLRRQFVVVRSFGGTKIRPNQKINARLFFKPFPPCVEDLTLVRTLSCSYETPVKPFGVLNDPSEGAGERKDAIFRRHLIRAFKAPCWTGWITSEKKVWNTELSVVKIVLFDGCVKNSTKSSLSLPGHQFEREQ